MKQIVRLVVTLFLITAIVAAALAGVNSITEDKIAQAKEAKNQMATQKVLPEGKDLKSVEFTDETGIVKEVFAPSGNKTAGQYAVKVTPSGFGGELTMMVGVADGKVSGVAIVSHAETPSLGATAASNNSKGTQFREQFVGLSGDLAVTKDGGTVDAITSATITSRAVTDGVNAALKCAENMK